MNLREKKFYVKIFSSTFWSPLEHCLLRVWFLICVSNREVWITIHQDYYCMGKLVYQVLPTNTHTLGAAFMCPALTYGYSLLWPNPKGLLFCFVFGWLVGFVPLKRSSLLLPANTATPAQVLLITTTWPGCWQRERSSSLHHSNWWMHPPLLCSSEQPRC